LEWWFFSFTVAKVWPQYLQQGEDVDFPSRLSVNFGLLFVVGLVAILFCNPEGILKHGNIPADDLFRTWVCSSERRASENG
jgi:hypothetical protein